MVAIKKIILFGIRNSYQIEIEELLSDEFEIVAYSDLDRDKLDSKHINYRPLIRHDSIQKYEFDYVVIAYKNRELSGMAKEFLIRECRVEERRILEYYKWSLVEYPSLLDVWRKSKEIILYDSIMVGMSHSVCGIDTNYAKEKLFGGSIGSADVDIMRKCLNAILSTDKGNIQRVIVEVPYYIFNWKVAYSLVYHRVFPIITDSFFKEKSGVSEDEIFEYELFERMFRAGIERNQYVFSTKRARVRDHMYRTKLTEDEIYIMSQNLSHVWTEHFEIIPENVNVFEKMLAEIKQYNDKIKIQIVVMPQNPIFIKINRDAIYNMKSIFYQNVLPICKKYKIEVFDFFEEYFQNKEYFFDYCHLNPRGRMEFSKLFVKEVLGES